jgi:hypothetical protein
METSFPSPRPTRMHRLRLILSSIAVCLIATTALAVPYVLHTVHAASSTHVTSICAQPPAGKDLTTMSAQQLQDYGIPAHLTNRPHWKTIASHLKHRFCFPAATPAPAVQHGLMQPQLPSLIPPCPSPCMSGVQGTTSSRFPVTFIHGSWGVPCNTAFSPTPNQLFDTWIGTGKTGFQAPLMRVGVREQQTFIEVNTPGGPIPTYDPVAYMYYQDTADPSTAGIQPGFGVSCGDQVEAFAWISPRQSMELFAMDDTTGLFFDVFVNPNVDDSNVACAVQDPNDGILGLAFFDAITFSDCVASTNGREGVGLLLFPSSVVLSGYLPQVTTIELLDGSVFSVHDTPCFGSACE